jgi:hypothetical protein
MEKQEPKMTLNLRFEVMVMFSRELERFGERELERMLMRLVS